MGSTNQMITNQSPVDWLYAQQAYNLNIGGIVMLEQAKEIMMEGNYYWSGIPIPTKDDYTFTARQSKEFTMSVEPGAFLISLGGYSDQTEGFSLSVMDKGSKTKIFSTGFAKSQLPIVGNGVVENVPIGPFYLTSPYPLTKPGQVQVQLTNLSSSTAIIQVLMNFAVKFNPGKFKNVVGNVNERIPSRFAIMGSRDSGRDQRKRILPTDIPIVI